MHNWIRKAVLPLIVLNFGCAATPSSGPSWLKPAWLGPTWIADYEEAERVSADAGKGTLFLFTNKDLTRDDPIREYLEPPSNRGQAADYVLAALFQNNEVDRRYAAQFGVHRAPAVILSHADGTFHAVQGSLSPEKLDEFLARASPPGAAPSPNPNVHRRAGYAWYRDWNAARQAAQDSGRPIFVVLERWMSRDWETLRPMLERREVISRVANMIHCRPATPWSSASPVAAELGVQNLPAVAIVRPDSSSPLILELPTSHESIARFAAQIKADSTTAD